MKTTPITKVLFNRQADYRPFLDGPYKIAKTNEFFEKATEIGEEKFFKVVEKSLDAKPFADGSYNNVFKLKDLKGYLIRVNKEYSPLNDLRKGLGGLYLVPLKKNPNHRVAQLGVFEIVKEIQGTNVLDINFINALGKFPQKSFNNFLKKIKENAKKGFFHDGMGANTLIDKKARVIETIDSFTEGSQGIRLNYGKIKNVLMSLLENDYSRFGEDINSIILKKTLKALVNKMDETYSTAALDKLKSELSSRKRDKIIRLFKKTNNLKIKMPLEDINEIKTHKNWNKLKKRLRKLNRTIDEADIRIINIDKFL